MRHTSLFICTLILITIAACSRTPYHATNKVYKRQAKTYAARLREQPRTAANDTIKAPPCFVGTTNFTMRKPNFVIIHHTAQESSEQTLKTFTLPRTEVSAHYLIGRDGTVYHLLNDYMRAHHAGLGKWGNVRSLAGLRYGSVLCGGTRQYSRRSRKKQHQSLGFLKRKEQISKLLLEEI